MNDLDKIVLLIYIIVVVNVIAIITFGATISVIKDKIEDIRKAVMCLEHRI